MKDCSLAFIFVLVFSHTVVAQGLNKGAAEISSDKLEVDHGKKHALFSGHVHAVYNDLTLDCDKMGITYDDKGAVVALHAQGGVVVVRGAARATASTARLDAKQGLLVLEGKPTLAQGSHRLFGKRIAVHLTSGKLEVLEASGTFTLGEKTK
jgi:lipopolysaccharide transport protein LptA